MLKECGKVSARLDTRLPITVSILARMCNNCAIDILPVCSEQCIPLLFSAPMPLKRIGVLATQAPNVIQFSQVTKHSNASGFMASVKLTFHQFKHHYHPLPGRRGGLM